MTCPCVLCTGPARMKLSALVRREPLATGQMIEHAAFWALVSSERVR